MLSPILISSNSLLGRPMSIKPEKSVSVGNVNAHKFSEFAILVFLKANKFLSVKNSSSSSNLLIDGGFMGEVGANIASKPMTF